jgi:hypothetical protein
VRHHDPVCAAIERAGDQGWIVAVDPHHAHHAPEVAGPGHIGDVLPGRREVLHLAHDGVEAQAPEKLAHVRRVVAHHQGDEATLGELLLGRVRPKISHHSTPIS